MFILFAILSSEIEITVQHSEVCQIELIITGLGIIAEAIDCYMYLNLDFNYVFFPGPSDHHEFQAETRKLLDIVARSLYSEKEVNPMITCMLLIFTRENARWYECI